MTNEIPFSRFSLTVAIAAVVDAVLFLFLLAALVTPSPSPIAPVVAVVAVVVAAAVDAVRFFLVAVMDSTKLQISTVSRSFRYNTDNCEEEEEEEVREEE